MPGALSQLLFLPGVSGRYSVLNPFQIDLLNALTIIAINRFISIKHTLPITYDHRTLKTSFPFAQHFLSNHRQDSKGKSSRYKSSEGVGTGRKAIATVAGNDQIDRRLMSRY